MGEGTALKVTEGLGLEGGGTKGGAERRRRLGAAEAPQAFLRTPLAEWVGQFALTCPFSPQKSHVISRGVEEDMRDSTDWTRRAIPSIFASSDWVVWVLVSTF